MNKTRFILILLGTVLLYSSVGEHLSSDLANGVTLGSVGASSLELATGIAPFEGRGKEPTFYPHLTKEPRSYASWVRDGHKYMKRLEFEQAILAFRKATKLQPASQEARFLLAQAYEKRGLEGLPGDYTQWDRLAAQEYELAVALADHLPARYNLALLQLRIGSLEASRRNLEHILLVGKPNHSLYKKAEQRLAENFEQAVRPGALSVVIQGDSGYD